MAQTTLEYLKEMISSISASDYADELMAIERNECKLTSIKTVNGKMSVKEEKVSYEKYMKESWGAEGDTLEKCMERSRMSKLRTYAEMIEDYTDL